MKLADAFTTQKGNKASDFGKISLCQDGIGNDIRVTAGKIPQPRQGLFERSRDAGGVVVSLIETVDTDKKLRNTAVNQVFQITPIA
jgi:hypothetical protein